MGIESSELSARFDAPQIASDLAYFFPVASQTSPNDKLCLLGAMRMVRKRGRYAYVEIGSFRGGSLTPFLMDPACERVLSIDDRGRVQPDERGINYDYSAITTQTMLDELHRCGIKTDKLKTFDGSVHALNDDHPTSFDLAFIDGEHTDEACFRDLLWTLPLMKPDAIIAFHDSTLVYKALKLIMLYLDKTNIEYKFVKRADSEMTALLLGRHRDVDHVQYLGSDEDPSTFFVRAEAVRIKSQFRNRARFRFAPRKLLAFRIPLVVDIERPREER